MHAVRVWQRTAALPPPKILTSSMLRSSLLVITTSSLTIIPLYIARSIGLPEGRMTCALGAQNLSKVACHAASVSAGRRPAVPVPLSL